MPGVELRDDQRPTVELAEGTGAVGGAPDEATARRITDEAVHQLLLADLAVERGDADLSAAVATGPYLEELAAGPAVPAPDRFIDTAVVDVVRDPAEFQALPRLAVTLEGTVDGDPWSSTYHLLPTRDGVLIEREVPAES